MGKGKGAVEFWAAKVKPGRIMFEIDGVERGRRQGGPAPRGHEAADQVPVRRPRGLVGKRKKAPGTGAFFVSGAEGGNLLGWKGF